MPKPEPKFKPFATYNAEGDSFTLHFYLGKAVGGAVTTCLRCSETMAGFVGPLGICSGGPGSRRDSKCCNESIFPYLHINKGEHYHDHEVTPAQLAETFAIAANYLDPDMAPPPGGYNGWNHTGLTKLQSLIMTALMERDVRNIAQKPVCAQCGFNEPCGCAAFSQQEVTKCQDTTQ